MEEENKPRKNVGSIERLQKELYSRDAPDILNEGRHQFGRASLNVKEEWEHPNDAELKRVMPESKPKKLSLLKKSLIFSAIFFVLASIFAFFIVFGGFNFISSQKIEIEVSGQSSIEGGEELILDVLVSNNNRMAIEDLSFTVEYPEGARDSEDPLNVLSRQQGEIESIASGGSDTLTFKSILYGERQSIKTIRILLEYKTENSSAVFYKEKLYEVGIKSAPVLITANFPKEVSDGQEAEFKITVASNSNVSLTGLLLVAQYPFGFAPTKSSPEPFFDDKVWSLGDIEPGGKKEIIIRGKVAGQENEEKVFKFAVGSESPSDERIIGVEFVSDIEKVFIRKPFMSLGVDINKTLTGDYVTRMGSTLKVIVDWKNNLPSDLNDAVLEVRLNGKSLDELSVSVGENGFYRSQDNIIIWDKNTTDILSRVRPGQSGSFDFTIGTFEPRVEDVSLFKNNQVDIEVTMKGVRFYESQAPENIRTSVSRKVKMETDLALSARSVYSIGPFVNSGPIPPKAEIATTYTVIWSISSNWNDADDVSVTAILPIYVDWLGKVNPSSAEVSFNEDTRIISWNASRVFSGTGFTSSPKEVAFQLSLTPSLAQVGTAPVLLENPSVIGTDTFTSTNITDKKPSLSTRIATDPIYEFGKEKVFQ